MHLHIFTHGSKCAQSEALVNILLKSALGNHQGARLLALVAIYIVAHIVQSSISSSPNGGKRTVDARRVSRTDTQREQLTANQICGSHAQKTKWSTSQGRTTSYRHFMS